MSTESPGACPVRTDCARMTATDLKHAARMFRQLPVDARDKRGRQLKRDAIAELLRLAERRTARSAP